MKAESSRFIIKGFKPAYLNADPRGELLNRARTAVELLRSCRVCPHNCGANRLAGEIKRCRIARYAKVASASAHFGEEACLSGFAGSGTIFFARCNLSCVFCQNWDISQSDAGTECTPEQIAKIILSLQEQGCHNINFVTPSHVVPQILEALAIAVDEGLRIPIVYNTNAYDSVQTLGLLEGLVDIYMPDFKLFSPRNCERYLNVKDYARHARQAIAEMHRQVGDLCLTPDGIACRGVLVRHLVMPGMLAESREIFNWFAEDISRDTYINIMAQYHPANKVGKPTFDEREDEKDEKVLFSEINRRPTAAEMSEGYALARRAGLWRFDKG